MAIAIKGELTGGAIASVAAMLEADAADTQNLISAINSFIEGTTTTLTGAGYDAARQKMALYAEDARTRQRLATELASAITSGASSLAGYMGEYSYLDDSEIPAIESQIKTLEAQINNARATLASLQSSDDPETRASAASYAQQITAWEATKKELQKKLDRLIGLAGADAAAFGAVQGAASQVAQYGASVQGIKVSTITTTTQS